MSAVDLVAGARALIEPLTGHTEGEWCADLSETYSVRERDGARIASCSHLNKLGRRSNDEAAANCRLSAAAPVMRDTIEALLDDRDALMQRIAELEAKPTRSKQQASVPRLSPGREFVLRYLDDKGPSSSWPICKSAMAEGVGYGMEWADKYLRWLRTSGLAARTGSRDSFGRAIHQITNAGRARLKADEDAE